MQGLFHARHFPDYVDQMLGFLASHGKNLDPGDRGTALYFVGIAAFACHDYQSATCFFDAAASEDFKVPKTESQPAHLFMCLDAANPNQAGLEIVRKIVKKLNQAIGNYKERTRCCRDFRQHGAGKFPRASDEAPPEASQNFDNYLYFVSGGMGLQIADDRTQD